MKKMGRPPRNPEDRELMKTVGKHLRWVREAMELSQEAIGEIVGCHQTNWSLYERGKRFPDEFNAVRIIAKLRLSRDYLLSGDLSGVDRDLAIRLAALHPELVRPRRTELGKGKPLI